MSENLKYEMQIHLAKNLHLNDSYLDKNHSINFKTHEININYLQTHLLSIYELYLDEHQIHEALSRVLDENY